MHALAGLQHRSMCLGFTYARRRPAFPSSPSPPPSGPRSLPAHTPRTPPHPRPTMQGRVAVAYERTGHIQGTTMPSTRPHSPTPRPLNGLVDLKERSAGAGREESAAKKHFWSESFHLVDLVEDASSPLVIKRLLEVSAADLASSLPASKTSCCGVASVGLGEVALVSKGCG
ncbi:hypothetical protein B0H14DRAFT_2637412 [Mycena olivaceomarginata]|nr:hypothetical protein B0H14DRAFT_2637412 [Mycena olivaceomarginata]